MKHTILIVDDEFHVVDGLQTMIDWDRLHVERVLTATDGVEAWELFQREQPDLVLTDVSMPRMNGLQFAMKIREINDTVPILILSGYDDFEYARGALHLHVTKYILKPAIYTEIEEALQEVITDMEIATEKNQYINQFMEQMKEHIPVLREQFLYNLVTSGKREIQSEPTALTFYELEPSVLSGGLVTSVSLYRPSLERAALETDWQLFKYAAVNIVEELADTLHIPAHILRYIDNRFIILIKSEDAVQAIRLAIALGEELIRQVSSILEIDLNIGIGRWCSTASEYPLSYQESLESLKWIEYEGINKLGTIEQIKNVQDSVPQYSMERMNLLIDCIRNHEVKAAIQHWLAIAQELKQAATPLYYIQNLSVSLISRMMLELFPEEQPAVNLHMTIQDIYRDHSIDNILTVVTTLLQNLLSSLQQRYNEQQQDGYIRKIEQFVEEHYSEEISFADLAKQMHLTRNYLSYLFKKEKGISFMTYLTTLRIQKAKELLRSKKYLVYEVAVKVGYSDAPYFSRVFKNATGTTPVEYIAGVF